MSTKQKQLLDMARACDCPLDTFVFVRGTNPHGPGTWYGRQEGYDGEIELGGNVVEAIRKIENTWLLNNGQS